MNKLSIIFFIAVVVIFGGIMYVAQSNVATTPTTTIPTLPPDADIFKPITKERPQVQGQTATTLPTQVIQPKPTFGVEEALQSSYSAVIQTTKGDITVMLFAKEAPKTVKNFISKMNINFYAGLTFHRIEDWVAQGGDPFGNGTGGGTMETELNDLPFVTGSLGIARGGDINVSNDSQFFITKSDASWLNRQYTNFGQVTSGMDIVNKLQKGDKIRGIMLE